MVYIHGGGYADGNGSRYGPQYFMDEDVVLITFQFRLGPFGTLCFSLLYKFIIMDAKQYFIV